MTVSSWSTRWPISCGGEELDFVTKLSRDGDFVRLTVNQARDTSTGVVPIELGVSQGGMLMVVVAADRLKG